MGSAASDIYVLALGSTPSGSGERGAGTRKEDQEGGPGGGTRRGSQEGGPGRLGPGRIGAAVSDGSDGDRAAGSGGSPRPSGPGGSGGRAGPRPGGWGKGRGFFLKWAQLRPP